MYVLWYNLAVEMQFDQLRLCQYFIGSRSRHSLEIETRVNVHHNSSKIFRFIPLVQDHPDISSTH